VQQYADETKRSQAQGLNTHSSHAPPDASRDLGVNARRFQKLNGLEVGTKTMVNPDQNVVVEAGGFLAVHFCAVAAPPCFVLCLACFVNLCPGHVNNGGHECRFGCASDQHSRSKTIWIPTAISPGISGP
jgi:hypothetical protein